MIPFARILNYGNIAPVPVLAIKKFDAGVAHRAVLYTDGVLYTSGNGGSYKLGTGDNTNHLQDWVKVQEDVDDVWCGVYCTLIRKKDGSYWHCGVKSAIYGVSTNNIVWADCTNLFSGFASGTILDINVGTFTTVLRTSNNDLYGIGLNNNYSLGMYGAQTTFVKIAEGVSGYSFGQDATLYIKNGTVYCAGSNTSSKLSQPGTVSTVNTFTAMPKPTGSTAIAVENIGDSTYVLYQNDSTGVVSLYNCGNNAGNLGTGNTSNVLTLSLVPSWDDKVVSFYSNGKGTAIFSYLGKDGIYSAGYNVQRAVGVGLSTNTISTYTIVPNLTPENVINIFGYSSTNQFAWCKDGIYWCGMATQVAGTVNQTSYVKLAMPVQV